MGKNTKSQAGQDDPFWLDHRDRQARTHFWRWPSRRERRREELLRDWFGPDLAGGEIQSRRRPATPLEQSVDALMCELGKGYQVLLEQIRDHWPELAGADIARQARPLRVYQGCLEIEVVNSMWLYELQTRMKLPLTERLAEFTNRKVDSLRFVPAGRRAQGR